MPYRLAGGVTMSRPCKRRWEVDSIRDGLLSAAEAASFERHRRTCRECTAHTALAEQLSTAVAHLPDAAAPDLALRRLRGQILGDAAAGLRGARARRLVTTLSLAGVIAIALINLFVWPSKSPQDVAPHARERNGYHLVRWSNSAMSFWAVSDLNEKELAEFVKLWTAS